MWVPQIIQNQNILVLKPMLIYADAFGDHAFKKPPNENQAVGGEGTWRFWKSQSVFIFLCMPNASKCHQLTGHVLKCWTTSFKQSVWKTCAHTVIDSCSCSHDRAHHPVPHALTHVGPSNVTEWVTSYMMLYPSPPPWGLPPSKYCMTVGQRTSRLALLQESVWKTSWQAASNPMKTTESGRLGPGGIWKRVRKEGPTAK